MVWKPSRVATSSSVRGSRSVSNVLSLIGLVLSGLVVILFVADLAAGFPFQRASVTADIGFILAGLIVAYLSWSINERAKPRPKA